MATTAEQFAPSSRITSRLARLRLAIRGYYWAQGIALMLAALVAGFWLSLAVDWVFEPTRGVRLAILVLIAAGVVAVAYRYIIRRMLVPLSDRNMAMLLERRHQQLGDRLLTVVELGQQSAEAAGFDPTMLSHTHDEAQSLVPAARIGNVFNARPLVQSFLLAAVAIGSVLAFAVWKADAMDIWFGRSLMLGDQVWPRETSILVEGFPKDASGRRVVKVARGSKLKILAKADTELAIPDALQIRYQTGGGVAGRPKMTQLKKAVPGRDAFQEYEYEFKNVQSTIVFDVQALHGGIFGKNDRVEDLVIEAVESPDLTDITLVCKYPDYLQRQDEQFSVRLVKPLPEGTDITILAEASKDLVAAEYRLTADDPNAPWQQITLDDERPKAIEFPLGPLAADTRVGFQLQDTDKVTNQQPIRLLIRIVPDEPPKVDAFLVGVGKAVTPAAALPIRGSIWDDHGLARTWIEYRVDADEPGQRNFEVPAGGKLDDRRNLAFQVEDLELAPGQKLMVGVKAADRYTLADTPHVGLGQRYELQIVSEDELRAMLEIRERLLRRRFEGVIAEMERAKDMLSQMGDNSDDATTAEDKDSEEADAEATGDSAAESPTAATGRRASLRILRTEQASQTSERNGHEVGEIAEEFGRVLLELDNNNVSYIEQFETRIGEGVVAPLQRIAGIGFPTLQDRLKQLRATLDDDARRPDALAAAVRQIDSILRDMDQVLENMLDLQKFNQLLADLRKIINSHKKVSKQTAEEREKIRQRLKDELKKGLLD